MVDGRLWMTKRGRGMQLRAIIATSRTEPCGITGGLAKPIYDNEGTNLNGAPCSSPPLSSCGSISSSGSPTLNQAAAVFFIFTWDTAPNLAWTQTFNRQEHVPQ